MKINRHLINGLLLAIFVVIFDQWSKWAVLDFFTTTGTQFLEITSFFNLVMVWNKGISFGLFGNHAYSPIIFTVLATVISVILLGWLRKSDSLLLTSALGLVIGGAVGNIIDRINYGAVADFLDVHLGQYHWPAFNIADSAICIGVVLLSIDSIFFTQKSSAAAQPDIT